MSGVKGQCAARTNGLTGAEKGRVLGWHQKSIGMTTPFSWADSNWNAINDGSVSAQVTVTNTCAKNIEIYMMIHHSSMDDNPTLPFTLQRNVNSAGFHDLTGAVSSFGGGGQSNKGWIVGSGGHNSTWQEYCIYNVTGSYIDDVSTLAWTQLEYRVLGRRYHGTIWFGKNENHNNSSQWACGAGNVFRVTELG